MNKVSVKLRGAMERKNVAPDKIDRIIQAITSFALYGFPESHAISFAILAYGSTYLKVHRAPEFYASLINNQPMGFYTPATIVKDAQRHGVKIKSVCVKRSDWRCTVLDDNTFRLGFCVVNGLRQEHGEQIERERQRVATASPSGGGQFKSLEDFKLRVPLSKEELRTLAELGALNCLAEHRRTAMWQVEEILHDDLLGSARAPRATFGALAECRTYVREIRRRNEFSAMAPKVRAGPAFAREGRAFCRVKNFTFIRIVSGIVDRFARRDGYQECRTKSWRGGPCRVRMHNRSICRDRKHCRRVLC